MRKLMRSIARANMKDAGIQHINKVFAANWRKNVIPKVVSLPGGGFRERTSRRTA